MCWCVLVCAGVCWCVLVCAGVAGCRIGGSTGPATIHTAVLSFCHLRRIVRWPVVALLGMLVVRRSTNSYWYIQY